MSNIVEIQTSIGLPQAALAFEATSDDEVSKGNCGRKGGVTGDDPVFLGVKKSECECYEATLAAGTHNAWSFCSEPSCGSKRMHCWMKVCRVFRYVSDNFLP